MGGKPGGRQVPLTAGTHALKLLLCGDVAKHVHPGPVHKLCRVEGNKVLLKGLGLHVLMGSKKKNNFNLKKLGNVRESNIGVILI